MDSLSKNMELIRELTNSRDKSVKPDIEILVTCMQQTVYFRLSINSMVNQTQFFF